MSDVPEIEVAFSIQNDGNMIGIHFNMPMSAHVIALPLASAEALANNFGTQLHETINAARSGNASSSLVIANDETLNVLKGK